MNEVVNDCSVIMRRLSRINELMERLDTVWPHWENIKSGMFIFKGEKYCKDKLLADCFEVCLLGRYYKELNMSGIGAFLLAHEKRLRELAINGELCSVVERVRELSKTKT